MGDMGGNQMDSLELEYYPVTSDRWADLEALFGPRGACGGCWCMYWRGTRSEYSQLQGEGNRLALKSIVDSGEVPGLLAYHNGKPVGWISVEPRTAFAALERSRLFKPVDERPVWSVVCFFVARGYRRKGVTVGLLNAAVEHARQHGAQIVEGYPVEPKGGKSPDPFVYTGLVSAFRKAGFTEVVRRSETRPIMRKNLQDRCGWAGSDPLYVAYHDQEWGVPLHDDRLLFEFLILDGMQAGLSWATILKKRDNFRRAFDDFDPYLVAQYGDEKVAALLADPGIVRNRLKVAAAVQNARAFLEIQREYGSFDAYIWQFVGGKPKQNAWVALSEIPARTPESDAMSKDLTRRGFKFVGSTICYAFMQAAGMVNDHIVNCFRYNQV